MALKDFSESAKGFTKNPLGIIALFIALVYALATMAVTFGDNLQNKIEPLIYFLVTFPVIVFIGFLWLVSKHHDKIYGPSDFKNEDNFIRMKSSTIASLAAASTSKHDIEKSDRGMTQEDINTIVDLVYSTKPHDNKENWKNHILWVDDKPENNVYERKAFESQGIVFSLAESTNQALELLKKEKFAIIISDMARKEGPEEGFILLEKIREKQSDIPFFIYVGSNLEEYKSIAIEKGAQGCTNMVKELYQMVMDTLQRI